MVGQKLLYFCFLLHLITSGILSSLTVEIDQHLTSFVGVTYRECFHTCQVRVSCRRILFRRTLTYCKLFGDSILSNTLGHRTPGVVHKEKPIGPQLATCDSCESGQTCGDKCVYNECPIPTAGNNVQIFGNMRSLDSKIKHECVNQFTEPAHSSCHGDGAWSMYPAFLSCEVYAYATTGPNTYKGWRYSPTDSNRFSVRSEFLDTCLALCNRTTTCFGVNFSPETRTCESINIHSTLSDEQHALHEMQGWHYYYQILPISHYTKNVATTSRYQFTYNEAVAYCEAIGTIIASFDDMLTAFRMGFNLCSCGWLNDGNAYLSLTSQCGALPPGVTQCKWGTKWNVYCKDRRFRSW